MNPQYLPPQQPPYGMPPMQGQGGMAPNAQYRPTGSAFRPLHPGQNGPAHGIMPTAGPVPYNQNVQPQQMPPGKGGFPGPGPGVGTAMYRGPGPGPGPSPAPGPPVPQGLGLRSHHNGYPSASPSPPQGIGHMPGQVISPGPGMGQARPPFPQSMPFEQQQQQQQPPQQLTDQMSGLNIGPPRPGMPQSNEMPYTQNAQMKPPGLYNQPQAFGPPQPASSSPSQQPPPGSFGPPGSSLPSPPQQPQAFGPSPPASSLPPQHQPSNFGPPGASLPPQQPQSFGGALTNSSLPPQQQAPNFGSMPPQQFASPGFPPRPPGPGAPFNAFPSPNAMPPQGPPSSGGLQFDGQNATAIPQPPTPTMISGGPTMGSHPQPFPGSESHMQARYPSAGMVPGGAVGHSPHMNAGYNRMPAPGAMPAQQQQQRRLDPELMPSPIQVIEDDIRNRSGPFNTNLRGQVPPLVTTDFITQDQGNSNPRFMRSTIYSVPSLPDIIKQTSIPFAVTIAPFAEVAFGEYPPAIVNMGETGPVRCIRCKAYMCPFMQFVDGGRRFQCSFCRATTEVPPDYFAHLDHTGQRVDKYDRLELCLGSYEFVATKDYCKNNQFPNPPAFVFVIDVSYNNMKNGMVNLLCQNIVNLLQLLPKENENDTSKVKVGFITYSNVVHFYNLKSCLAQPQMMIVSDVNDMFVPLLDGFLVDARESEGLIMSLMEQIPLMFADTRETETILGPAIQAGMEALKASDTSGKLFVFHSSLPISEAPGKLKNRDDRKLLGTEKEKTVLAPQSTYYNQLGQDCVSAGACVDIFAFPNSYVDIATIGQVCRLTGGQLYKYTYFQAELDGPRFMEDLKRDISRNTAFDAIMRVRTSTGIRPVEFFGNFYMSNTTDIELAAVDSDKAITVEIKHDDKLTDEDAVYIQAAILYTSVSGQRRLRVHNLSMNTCNQMADLYRSCELDTIMNYLSKSCLRQLCEQTPKAVKESLVNRCAQTLACYRKNCASVSASGQLILPECMKLLPLFANCLLKTDAVSGGSEMSTDERSFVMHCLNSMPVSDSVVYIYPRLMPLHTLNYPTKEMPTLIRTSMDKISDNGVYLLENGLHMFLWIGMNVSPDIVQNLFGVQSATQIDIDKTTLLELDNPISQGIRQIIAKIVSQRRRNMRLTLVRQRDKLEFVFKQFLVEDKGLDGSPSYVDFLCHMHKEIRNLLS